MRTYTLSIEKPLLKISYSCDNENPREWSNLGMIISKQSIITDEECKPLVQDLIDTQYRVSNIQEHLEKMNKIMEEYFNSKVVFSIPLLKYEHSAVKYYTGYDDGGWDCSCVGFVFVTEDKLKEIGIENDIDKISDFIDGEMETLTKWVNNEIYQYELYGEQGELIESCGGFYDLEDIKDHLPNEWQNEYLEEYLQLN